MRTRLLLLGIVVVGAAVSLLRVPMSHVDTVWAEDGQIFLQEAIDHGPWTVLVNGYAGYQHLVPRLVAAVLVSTAPLDAYGILVFVVCAILVGLVAAAVFWLSRELVPWLPARLALAAITVLLPLAAQEVLGNLADLHSYAMWLTPWMLLYRPRTWLSGVGWGVVVLLCAMTEIQTIIYLPLLILMIPRRHRMAWPIGAALILGIAAQVITTLVAPRPSTAQWLGLPSLILGYLYNTFLPMADPNPYRQADLLLATGWVIPAIIAIPFVVAAVAALWWGTPRQRVLVVTLVLASGAVYAGGATADGGGYFAYATHENIGSFYGILNSRYGVASGMLIAGVVPLAAAVLLRRFPTARASRIIAWVAVVGLVTVFAAASTQSVSARSTGVTWSGGIAEARAQCVAESLSPETKVAVPNAPSRLVGIPCGWLTD